MEPIRIEKSQGTLNELIYDHTVYNDGRYRIYLSILGLKSLSKRIALSHVTTQYVRFIPFYKNGKIERQVEFDEYMLFLSCRDSFSEVDEKKHQEECLAKSFEEMDEEEIRRAKIRFPLCRFDDPDTFSEKIFDYLNLLNEIVPEMKQELLDIHEFREDDLIFGEFCFEINSK